MTAQRAAALTIAEAAQLLKVSPSQVRQLIRLGKLRSFELPTAGSGARLQRRIPPSEIDRIFGGAS